MDQHRKIVTTQIIEDVVNKSLSDKIQIRDIINAMQSSGFGVAMVIFAFAIIDITHPIKPTIIPIITNNPSLPIKPKEVINIPRPGIKFEKGTGIKTNIAKINIIAPINLSKIE